MTPVTFRRLPYVVVTVAFFTAAVTSVAGASDVPVGSTDTTVAPVDRLAVAAVAPKGAEKTLVLKPVSNVVKVPMSKVAITAVGSRDGAATKVLQQRLLALGFWLQQADGTYDKSTRQAVMAFQKFRGLDATGEVDLITASFLQFATVKGHGSANSGSLVEVDKTKQLLFLVQHGTTVWTINASTGSGEQFSYYDPHAGLTRTEKAVTPEGLFMTNRERTKGWWEGDLGKIYRPKYFSGGIAVHGMTSVPAVPASHGCVRVSLMAMDFLWNSNLVPLHTPVWVHR